MVTYYSYYLYGGKNTSNGKCTEQICNYGITTEKKNCIKPCEYGTTLHGGCNLYCPTSTMYSHYLYGGKNSVFGACTLKTCNYGITTEKKNCLPACEYGTALYGGGCNKKCPTSTIDNYYLYGGKNTSFGECTIKTCNYGITTEKKNCLPACKYGTALYGGGCNKKCPTSTIDTYFLYGGKNTSFGECTLKTCDYGITTEKKNCVPACEYGTALYGGGCNKKCPPITATINSIVLYGSNHTDFGECTSKTCYNGGIGITAEKKNCIMDCPTPAANSKIFGPNNTQYGGCTVKTTCPYGADAYNNQCYTIRCPTPPRYYTIYGSNHTYYGSCTILHQCPNGLNPNKTNCMPICSQYTAKYNNCLEYCYNNYHNGNTIFGTQNTISGKCTIKTVCPYGVNENGQCNTQQWQEEYI